MKKSIVTAHYLVQSTFVTDIDLNEVYNWWVKWDKLIIQINEQDTDTELIRILPNSDENNFDDFGKYPNQLRKVIIDC